MLRFWADYSLMLLLVVSAGVLLFEGVARKRWQLYPYVIMAGLTSLLVAKLVSLVYQPAALRPFLEQGVAAGAAFIDNPGFPSDHVLLGTVVVIAVYVVTRRRLLSVLLLALVVAMAIARVVALVHTPFDVLGGFAIGCIGALWYLMMPRRNNSKA